MTKNEIKHIRLRERFGDSWRKSVSELTPIQHQRILEAGLINIVKDLAWEIAVAMSEPSTPQKRRRRLEAREVGWE